MEQQSAATDDTSSLGYTFLTTKYFPLTVSSFISFACTRDSLQLTIIVMISIEASGSASAKPVPSIDDDHD